MFAPNLRIIWLLFGWYESEKNWHVQSFVHGKLDSLTISFNASIFTSSHTTINITNVWSTFTYKHALAQEWGSHFWSRCIKYTAMIIWLQVNLHEDHGYIRGTSPVYTALQLIRYIISLVSAHTVSRGRSQSSHKRSHTYNWFCYDIFLGTLYTNLEFIGIALPRPPPDSGVRNWELGVASPIILWGGALSTLLPPPVAAAEIKNQNILNANQGTKKVREAWERG